MLELKVRAWAGLAALVLVMAGFLFLPAWTVLYWQAWVFLALFSAETAAITAYLMKHDPDLLERRVKAGPISEKDPIQKLIQSVASLAFVSILLISALDHRFAWSRMGTFFTVLGDLWVGAGLLAVFFVFKENTFTSATIEVGAKQTTISTGPYALVRHPMYAGAFVMLLGVPLSLASWWGLFAVLPLIGVIVWRLFAEEEYLGKNLEGYLEYQSKVKYRLVPWVW
ncbi:MAG TPA: isoprenylcysteine carboxylmethyltransferase family protein [bacterium]|nr:isoprenylcysteine carboxylmethyltransferase family protein [bacterium]